MKERLIKWLGGYTHEEYNSVVMTMRRLDSELDSLRGYVQPCTKTDGCWMRDGHGGGCREWHGLCFSTMHQKDLRRKREERDRKALAELTAPVVG